MASWDYLMTTISGRGRTDGLMGGHHNRQHGETGGKRHGEDRRARLSSPAGRPSLEPLPGSSSEQIQNRPETVPAGFVQFFNESDQFVPETVPPWPWKCPHG
jgi:hypothetical protein